MSATAPQTVEQLDDLLSRPPSSVVEALSAVDGDLVLLGAGGKMGPTLARMALRAGEAAGRPRRVIAVSRFSDPEARDRLRQWGVETIACDLLDPQQVSQLPAAPLVIAMAGFKFGATARPDLSWATNCLTPAAVCSHYRDSRIVAFSTGNVYGLTSPERGGSVESDPPSPIGEYAMAALGRERIFQYCSQLHSTPVTILRLNYATELRYGVLVDLARRVWDDQTIPLTMSHVNVIWQGDANAMTLQSLTLNDAGCQVLNLAGPEILRVRDVSRRLAELLERDCRFSGEESFECLLNNGTAAYATLGEPQIASEQMLQWTADWVRRGGPHLDKPTRFEASDGKF